MSAKIDEWIKVYDREEITKYLPYQDFDEKHGIYATNDGGFGLILECDPLIYPSANSENSLLSALQILPDDAYVQFHLLSSPNITHVIDTWESKKSRTQTSDIAKEITTAYKKFLEEKIDSPISENFQSPTRNYKVVISVKLGGKDKQFSIFNHLLSFVNIKKTLKSMFIKDEFIDERDYQEDEVYELKRKYTELITAKDRFIGALKKAYLNPKVMNVDGLIKFHYEVLNMNHDFRNIPKWDGTEICNHLFAYDNKAVIRDDETIIDKKHIKVLSVKEYPEEWGMYEVIKFAGDILSNQTHAVPFLITLNVHKLSETDGKDKITRSATITNGQQMPYSLFPKLKYIHKDLTYGMDKLQKGASPFYFSFQIATFSNSEKESQNIAGQTRAYFKTLRFNLEEDNFVTLPALLSMLPLGYDKKIQEFLGNSRGRIAFSENVTDLAPITADWYGTRPQVPFISPRGQAFGLDLFDGNIGGYNGFCVGTTGSGKSVFLQWVLLNYWLSGNKCWVIDIGRSYEKLCKILKGQFIEFKKDSNISLNPFTSITDYSILNEYLEFITNLYLLLGLPKEVKLSEQLEKLMKKYLLDAISLSYAEYGNESEVDTIVEMLIQVNQEYKDARLEDFIKHLSPYQKNQIYGTFLNGKCEVDFSSDMVVLECAELEQMPDILNPIMMVLTFQISKEIYLTEKTVGNFDKRNIVVMDEAHKFLGKSAHVELFIEQAYRRFRKHGASMILGTQGFEDLYGDGNISKAGRVIIDNSNWNFFLKQKSTSREKIKKSGYYSLSDFDKSLMDSVEPMDGEYGEVLIMNDKITTKARIVLDDFLKALLFTNSEERAFIDSLISAGIGYRDAVDKLMEKRIQNGR